MYISGWLIYDDETGQIVKIADKIIRLPDGVQFL